MPMSNEVQNQFSATNSNTKKENTIKAELMMKQQHSATSEYLCKLLSTAFVGICQQRLNVANHKTRKNMVLFTTPGNILVTHLI